MKVINVKKLFCTERHVECPKKGFTSIRILLEKDGMGYTMTKTFIPKGLPQAWHYKHHLETCFCVSGKGILTNSKTGEQHLIAPDTAYALDEHDAHTFEAVEDTVLICVFNPPLKGREVHNPDGSYEGGNNV